MNEQLSRLDAEFATVGENAARLLGRLSEAEAKRRPVSGGWSPGECVGHLTLTTERFLPLLDAALAKSGRLESERKPRYRSSFLAWLLAKSLEPPARVRFKTTPPFVPGTEESLTGIRNAFAKSQDALRARLKTADGRDLNRAMVQSPFNAKLSYNVYAGFRILAAHQRRHLWQAERAVAVT